MPHGKISFKFRAFISTLTGLSFLAALFTGLVLFITPPGRVARWSSWTFSGLEKEQWIALHICFCLVFAVAGIIHLGYNGRPLVHYFKSKVTHRFALRPEWITAVIVTGVIGWGALNDIPPFSSVMNLNEKIKFSWEEPDKTAPLPHAELLTLSELAASAGVELETMVNNLNARQIKEVTPETVFGDIAKANNLSPDALYQVAVGAKSSGQGGHGRGQGQGGGGAGGGRGMGRMTFSQACQSVGIEAEAGREKLKQAGIDVQPEMAMRDIAEQNGMTPWDIVDILKK